VPNKVYFHIHEAGSIEHREVADGDYTLLIVDLGRLTAEDNYWMLCLNIRLDVS
jgi:hypothetical protein